MAKKTEIKVLNSGTASAVPSLGVIAIGELAINYSDGIIYFKTAANTLGQIKTTQVAGLNTEIQFNNSGSFAGNSAVTFSAAQSKVTVPGLSVRGAYSLPIADGSAGTVLTADGSGAVTFAAASGATIGDVLALSIALG